MFWSRMGRRESSGCTVTFRTSLRSRFLVRMYHEVVDTFLPRPWKVCDAPPLCMLNYIFKSTRSWLLAKGSR